MTNSTFQQLYQGRFTSTLRWTQLDDLWTILRGQSGWYVYLINEELPQNPVSAQDLDTFIQEVDTLLRREHKHDYCGIVYADDLEMPTIIKIYDPNNLGAACGSSGSKVYPRWLLSQMQPEYLQDAAPLPNNRRRWWQNI